MKKMAKTNDPDISLHNNIGSGTKITGNIETSESIRIDGEIEGNIVSKGRVVIGPSGKIKGEVECSNSEISGTLHGKITVSELLSLKASSKLYGEIFTSKLSIEPGAIFTGKCDMGDNRTSNIEVKNPEIKK